jgi:hypothetical protein
MEIFDQASWHVTNVRQSMDVAEGFGLGKQYAINARRRFLTENLEELDDAIESFGDYEGNLASEHFALVQFSDLGIELAKTKGELGRLKNITVTKPDITEDMIETARRHPITSLIEFKRGKAVAFCHADRNPSMFHATRLNLAICPVCDKKFNPIDVLIERDGYSFKSAVKELQ